MVKSVIKQQFQKAYYFNEDEVAIVKQNGQYGIIDKKGDFIINPRFEDALGFSEGLAAAKQNGKWGYINKEGNWVIKPQFEDASGFTNSCAVVKQDGKWGCISKQGDWIVKPQFNNKKSLFISMPLWKKSEVYL